MEDRFVARMSNTDFDLLKAALKRTLASPCGESKEWRCSL
jgi:hypothetical protein